MDKNSGPQYLRYSMIRHPLRLDKRKVEMKEYPDKSTMPDLSIGDKVLIKLPKQNKMPAPFNPEPLQTKGKKQITHMAQNTDAL